MYIRLLDFKQSSKKTIMWMVTEITKTQNYRKIYKMIAVLILLL